MAVSWTMMRAIENLWKQKFYDRSTITFPELKNFVDDLMNNMELYGRSPTSKSESSKVFNGFVEYCMYRNIANYDSMVLITSEKGMGKSSFAIMLAKRWCQMLGIKFDTDRHIAYSNAQVSSKIDKLNPFEPIICDESIRFAGSEDWNKLENKELKKKLGQVRTKHLFYILCFPLKVMKLDKVYLESYVNYWIDLVGRGVGALYVKDKNPQYDAWRMKEFQKIGSYTEFTMLQKIHSALKKHPNFWYTIRAPKPPAALYEKYLKVREYNIYDDANVLDTLNKADVIRALLLLTLKEILTRDSSMSIKRVLLHLENTYDIVIPKKYFEEVMNDATMLAHKVRENNLGKYIK
jgi:hypothetical protein